MNKLFHKSLLVVSGGLFIASMQGCVTLGSPSGEVVVRDGNTRIVVSFNEHDRKLIHSYYGKKNRNVCHQGWPKRKNYHRGYRSRLYAMGSSRQACGEGSCLVILNES